MLKSDVDAYLECSARLWLDDHPEPLSPFVPASPGPCCAMACPALGRCSAGQRYVSLAERDTIRRNNGVTSAADIPSAHSEHSLLQRRFHDRVVQPHR